VNWDFVGDAFRHAQLPILVIIAISAGGWLLGMRNVMITTLSEDYVTMAHAKGLHDRRVMARYAARNAILPPLTGFASFFASAVGGLILIEVVFSYPGVGLAIQQAALGHDYPLVQALLLLLSVCVLVANFIMDCIYVVLDPRVRST
jgi:peptide/nickel transport system permease protein